MKRRSKKEDIRKKKKKTTDKVIPTKRMLNCIKEKERKMFRLILALDQEGCLIMKKIFNYCTRPTLSNHSLTDLIMAKNKWNLMSQFEGKVNRALKYSIKNDSSMDSFDITTWYGVLQYAGHGLALPNGDAWLTPDTLENNLKKLKDLRNHIMYSIVSISDPEFQQKMQDLKNLLVDIADMWKFRFSINESIVVRVKNSYYTTIDRMLDTKLDNISWDSFDRTPVFNLIKNILRTIGVHDLKIFFSRKLSSVSPTALILGEEMSVNGDEIYPQFDIVAGVNNRSNKQSDKVVCLDDLFEVVHSNDKNMILLEGRAGVGKTTIIKKIVSDWTGNNTVKGIEDYDYVIPIQCCDSLYDNINAIVKDLMPTAKQAFFDEETRMMECLYESKILFIFDGLDEVTQETEKIFKELLGTLNKSNFTIICTLRPEMMKGIYHFISGGISVLHLRIRGISNENKEVFIKKYCDKLQSLDTTIDINVNGLLKYLKTTESHLQEQWNLPLNLTLVTVLWRLDRASVLNITCAIELMIQIQDLAFIRLEKIQRNEKSTEECDEVKEKIKEFVSLLSEIALIAISDGNILIPQCEIQRLISKCTNSNLPSKEILGAFLLQRNSWSPRGLALSYAFSHKSLQEFYGALHIFDKNFRGSNDGKTIIDVFLEIKDETELEMRKFQGTLTYLLGILHHYKVSPTKDSVKEIINFLKKAGVEKQYDWINLLNRISFDQVVSETIVEIVPYILEGNVKICKENVSTYTALLPEKIPESVSIEIKGRPSDSKTLPKLFNIVANKGIPIDNLDLEYLFRHGYETQNIIQDLNTLMKWCSVKRQYKGRFPSGRGDHPWTGLLDTSSLWVSLTDRKEAMSFSVFLRKRERRHRPLRELRLCIGRHLTPGVIWSIPRGSVGGPIDVFLPDIENNTEGGRKRVGDILRSLDTGTRKFRSLVFPRYHQNSSDASSSSSSSSSSIGIQKLIQSIAGFSVRDYVSFPKQCRPQRKEEVIRLREMCKTILACQSGIYWYPLDDWE